MRSTSLRSGLLHLLSLALVVSLRHSTVAEWTWPSVSDHPPTILGRPVTGLSLSLALVLALPRTVAQSHPVVFDGPVLSGPKAVRVGSTATLTCVVPKVHYTRPQDFEVRWVVKFGHLPPANVSRTAVDVQYGGLSDVHQVTSRARLYFSKEHSDNDVQCVARLTRLDITKQTAVKTVTAYILSRPVMRGLDLVLIGTNTLWTCTVARASVRGDSDFKMVWDIHGSKTDDAINTYKSLQREEGSAIPVKSVTSRYFDTGSHSNTANGVVGCEAVLVGLNVSSSFSKMVTYTGARPSTRPTTTTARPIITITTTTSTITTVRNLIDKGPTRIPRVESRADVSMSKSSSTLSRPLLITLVAVGAILGAIGGTTIFVLFRRRRHSNTSNTGNVTTPTTGADVPRRGVNVRRGALAARVKSLDAISASSVTEYEGSLAGGLPSETSGSYGTSFAGYHR